MKGLLHVRPPSVERLVTTLLPCTPPASSRVSEEMSQTVMLRVVGDGGISSAVIRPAPRSTW